MTKIRFITAAGNIDREASVAKELGKASEYELILRCVERTEFLAAVRGARIDIALVVGAPRWMDRATLAEAAENEVRTVGIANDPLEAESLRRMGIELASPDSSIAEVIRSEPAATAPIIREPEPSHRGRLIAVWGPKGSPGRSTVAAELAAEVARSEPGTILVDADTYGGDLAQMFAVVEELPTIVWAAQAAADGRLDEEMLRELLRRTSPDGPVVLPGINRAELWTDISKFGWSQLLKFCARTFSFSVVDVGFGLEFDERVQHDRDRVARHTIAAADHVVAVCRADPVGLKNFLWSVERLKEIRDLDDVFVVVNRVVPGEADEVRFLLKRHLGKRPVTWLSFRPNEARQALDRGTTISSVRPSGDFCEGIRELAGAVGAAVPARGLLTRLAGRS